MPETLGLEIACAAEGSAKWTRCTVTRDGGRPATLTVVEPGGGFRRFRVEPDGRLTTADGAVPALASPGPGLTLEVRVEDDRYRFPARLP